MFRYYRISKCRGVIIRAVYLVMRCHETVAVENFYGRVYELQTNDLHPPGGYGDLTVNNSVEGDRFLPRDRSKPNPAESTGERRLSTGQLAQKGGIASGSVRRVTQKEINMHAPVRAPKALFIVHN